MTRHVRTSYVRCELLLSLFGLIISIASLGYPEKPDGLESRITGL
jgi:hypothetical protein